MKDCNYLRITVLKLVEVEGGGGGAAQYYSSENTSIKIFFLCWSEKKYVRSGKRQ